MQPLISNARLFPTRIADQRDRLAELARGQSPQAMFISCSDSRVVPALITGAQPGDIFELRTAGNIVPSYRPQAACAVAGTLDFAVQVLEVSDIVICGHSRCGAVEALTGSDGLHSMPLLRRWLGRSGYRSRAARRPAVVDEALSPVHRHLLQQLDHLRRYPNVADSVAQGKLRLHTWHYAIDTGEVTAYHPQTHEFRPL